MIAKTDWIEPQHRFRFSLLVHRRNQEIAMAIWPIVHFTLLPDYKIEVSFADDTSGIADLASRLSQGPLGDGFDPLCDEKVFSRAFLEYGALTWTGGINLAPDAMYQRIRATGTSVLAARRRVA